MKQKINIVIIVLACIAGVFIIPKLIRKVTNYIYKNTYKEISYDDFEPEIVKKDKGGSDEH